MHSLPYYFGGSWEVAAAWCYVVLLSGMGLRHLWRSAATLPSKARRYLYPYRHTLRYIITSAGNLVLEFNRTTALRHQAKRVACVEEEARRLEAELERMVPKATELMQIRAPGSKPREGDYRHTNGGQVQMFMEGAWRYVEPGYKPPPRNPPTVPPLNLPTAPPLKYKPMPALTFPSSQQAVDEVWANHVAKDAKSHTHPYSFCVRRLKRVGYSYKEASLLCAVTRDMARANPAAYQQARYGPLVQAKPEPPGTE